MASVMLAPSAPTFRVPAPRAGAARSTGLRELRWALGFSALSRCPKLRALVARAASRRRLGLSLATAVGGAAGATGVRAAESSRQLFRVGDGTPTRLPSSGFPIDLADDVDVVILGEHHDSSSDHSMEAEFTREFTKERGKRAGIVPAVGLEMVEQQFQPILDSFSRGEMSVQDLYDATEWSKRWVWPFDLYAPVFEAARENGAPLVALNPATEVRRRLPLEGLRALTPEERGMYLPDAVGFATTLRDPAFRSYADLVVMPSYDTHVAGEFLGSKDESVATPQNFLSARVFRDEAMAYAAWRYLNKDQRRGMLLIVGCDHVRYDYGIPARLKRLGSGLNRWQAERPLLLRATPDPSAAPSGRLATGEVFAADAEGSALRLQEERGYVLPDGQGGLPYSLVEGRKLKVASVLLNPTASEGLAGVGAPQWRLPAQNVQGPLLADYVWAEA